MKIIRKVDHNEVEETFCNKCGLSCRTPLEDESGLSEVEFIGSFNSSYFDDGDVHQFSLCDHCLFELVESFKYNSFQGNCTENDEDSDLEEYDEENKPSSIEYDAAIKRKYGAVSLTPIDMFHIPDEYDDDLDEDDEYVVMLPKIKKEDMN